MNFQITRIRLASVGPEPARYDPLLLDLRRKDNSGPLDTVLFLPNTGGKTVLMRLLFAVLHPPIVDRIGSEETNQRQAKDKNILGYVLDRDTSHIVVEWRRVKDGVFADDDILVTGLVVEWRGGRVTGKMADLERVWYSMRGSARILDIERLVFDQEVPTENGGAATQRRLQQRRYREQLEEFKKNAPRGKLDLTITEVQRDWVDHLDKLGLDSALFRYQGEMNHNEAGASAIARFKEDRDFIKFFLDAVFDPEELLALDHEFSEVADKVRRLPEYERRRRFEQAALDALEPLVGLVETLARARAETLLARTTAMSVYCAFRRAQATAIERASSFRESHKALDLEHRRLTQLANALRDDWREYRRIGAAMRLEEATSKHASAQTSTKRAELDVRAWSIAEHVVQYREASARVATLNEVYQEEIEKLRPLQTARDDAATALAGALAAAVVVALEDAAASQLRVKKTRERAAEQRNEERDALIEVARIDIERQGNERKLDETLAYRESLVTLGLLGPTQRTQDALDREAHDVAVADDRLDTIDSTSTLIERERIQLDACEPAAELQEKELRSASIALGSEVSRASEERDHLCADPLVCEVAESPTFDLELVGPHIAERLVARARGVESARLTLELQGADDRRALRSLQDTGFLPRTADVEATLRHLSDCGIRGAVSGPSYLVEAIPRAKYEVVARRRADLVGGIVLTDPEDLPKARAALASSSLSPASIVAVGLASDLIKAEEEETSATILLVPPSDAIWDRSAAGLEKERRQTRVSSLDEDGSKLDSQAVTARRLAETLVSHASSYPRGWLALKRTECSGLETELARLKREREDRNTRRSEITATLSSLRSEAKAVHARRNAAVDRSNKLARLSELEAETANTAAIIQQQLSEAESWRGCAKTAGTAALAADAAADSELSAGNAHRMAADRSRAELVTIKLSTSASEPSLPDALVVVANSDLPQLRVRFTELDLRLSGETSTSDTAARLDAAIESRNGLGALIETHSKEQRDRTTILLTSTEASTLEGRREAAKRADGLADEARAAERDAYVEVTTAQAELEGVQQEVRVSRRTAKLSQAPRDRHHAALLAAQARLDAETAQTQINSTEQAMESTAADAEGAEKLADGLKGLATQLEMGLKLSDDFVLLDVPGFDGTSDQANTLGRATSLRLSKAIDAEQSADNAWRKQDSAIRAVLTRDEFADLASLDPLYRRLAAALPEVLARDAQELVLELRSTINVLTVEIETLEQDRKLATTSLSKSVNKALGYLKLAEAKSKMPARLREWSGESFLEIRFTKPPAEELDIKLRTFVAEVLDPANKLPVGSTLLMQGLERAVGEFKAKILKPNEAYALIRVPVAELSSRTFSNGQRATVATALMLMLSELRRQSRTGARQASLGALLLDNPFGSANAGFLIEVQQTVAAAAGIQLIYLTGIADLNALRRFPNLIALSNDSARRTMRRWVRVNPSLLELLAPQNDAQGGRLTGARVVTLDRDADED